MRHPLHLVAMGSLGLLIGSSAVALAGEGPVVVYGAAPYDIPPPVAYVLDPADARRPIYVVDQGPVYYGPGIVALKTFATPIYSEGGYAYALPYPYIGGPYVRGHGDWDYGYAPVYRPRPWHGRYSRLDDAYGYGPRVYRRNVFRPYAGAYRYRPAPGARVIRVNEPAHEQRAPRERVPPPAATPPMPQARPQPPASAAPPAQAVPPAPAQPGTRPDVGGHSR